MLPRYSYFKLPPIILDPAPDDPKVICNLDAEHTSLSLGSHGWDLGYKSPPKKTERPQRRSFTYSSSITPFVCHKPQAQSSIIMRLTSRYTYALTGVLLYTLQALPSVLAGKVVQRPAPVCNSGTRECTSATTYQVCDNQGQWGLPLTCPLL
jgi:hypothetical protein